MKAAEVSRREFLKIKWWRGDRHGCRWFPGACRPRPRLPTAADALMGVVGPARGPLLWDPAPEPRGGSAWAKRHRFPSKAALRQNRN